MHVLSLCTYCYVVIYCDSSKDCDYYNNHKYKTDPVQNILEHSTISVSHYLLELHPSAKLYTSGHGSSYIQ